MKATDTKTVPASRPGRAPAVLAVVLCTTIWGTTYVATKVVLPEIPPFTLAFFRFVIATAIMAPFAWKYWRTGHGRALPWKRLVLMGLTGVALYFMFQNLGLVYTTASAAALIQGAIPAITILLAGVFLKERLGLWRVSGVSLSVAGVVLIVLASEQSGGAPAPLLGNLLMLGSSLAWGVYTITGKVVHESFPSLLTTAISTAVGTLFLLPPFLGEIFLQGFGPVSPAVWLNVFYLGAVASGLTFILWNYGLQALDAGETGNYINLVPVVAVASAVLLLGEPVRTPQVLGGLLVLAGVYLTGRR